MKIITTVFLTLSFEIVSLAQPMVELQKLEGDSSYYETFYGTHVSISGNYAIVGASEDYINDIKSGAAYIYYFNGTSWILQNKVFPSAATSYGWFGCSVCINGNYAIVGAYGDGENGFRAGAAFIFRFDGTKWVEMQKIMPNDPTVDDRFGSCVSISGNYAFVGSPGDDDFGSHSGSAYIFHYNGTSWTQQSKIYASAPAADDYFGTEVAISGNNAVVSISSGVHLYAFNGESWSEQTILTPSGNVSLSGDYLFIGESSNDDIALNAGAVNIYFYDGFTWTFQQKIYASDAISWAFFGGSVNIEGDLAIVGSTGRDDLGTDSGAAYVFSRSGTTWSELSKFIASDGDGYDNFGKSVGISGNFAIVGSEDNENLFGTSYVFGPPIPIITTQPKDQTNVCIGSELFFTIAGNYIESYQWQVDNGSGFQNITDGEIYQNSLTDTLNIVGLTEEMNNYLFRCLVINTYNTGTSDTAILTTNSPVMEMFCLNDTVIELQVGQNVYTVSGTGFDPIVTDDNCGLGTLENNYNQLSSLNGAEIPIGTTTVQWLLNDLSGNTDFCDVTITVTEYNPPQWFQIGDAIPGEAANDGSGSPISLSSDGTTIAIGAPENDGNGTSSGHVRIYENNSGNWVQKGQDIDGDGFWYYSGSAVSLNSNGTIVAIGTPSFYSSYVKVYEYSSGLWVLKGNMITGGETSDRFGESLSLNSDGSILAVGDTYGDPSGFSRGQVGVFKYISGTWTQIGNYIVGEHDNSNFGCSISLNSSGSVLAIGGSDNDGFDYDAGHVRVFENNNGTWRQIGSDIDGESAGDCSGFSVSLSSDGSIVAIGSPENADHGDYSGQVRVYENNSGAWTQLGNDLEGTTSWNSFGASVSINGNGTILAVGSPKNDDNGPQTGKITLYSFNSGLWTQIDEAIPGVSENDYFGSSVSVSKSGSTVAGGAPDNDDNGLDAGHVRVFHNPSLDVEIIPDIIIKELSIYPNPTNGILHIVIPEKRANYIQVTDITGKMIMLENNAQIPVALDLSKFESGIYTIRVITETDHYAKIIIKQ